MRSVATLLVLLLTLPGLVLPAGFMLRICRCAAAMRSLEGVPARSCCVAQPPPKAPPPPNCCGHCCRTADRSDHGAVQVTPRCCKCVFVKVPEHQQKPVLPQQAPSPDVFALPPATAVVIAVLGDAGRRLPTFEVARPPPPDRHRTLPLLL